jgi:hypothetical protein
MPDEIKQGLLKYKFINGMGNSLKLYHKQRLISKAHYFHDSQNSWGD